MTEIDAGNVTRYCKPQVLENGIPQSSAFEKRDSDRYLSVYLLDFFEKETELANVIEVKRYINEKGRLVLNHNGSFAVLNIQQSKEYILAEISLEISYKEENPPHCGIYHPQDILIAKLLSECVQNNYPIQNIS